MNSEAKKVVRDALLLIAEIHNRKVSQGLVKLYCATLDRFTAEQLRAGFTVVSGSRFFPKPADIIEAIEGTKEDFAAVADIAARKVIDSIGSVGSYRSVVVSDPAAHATLRVMGGWTDLCAMTVAELKWWRKEFAKLYPQFRNRPVDMEPLAGLAERCEVRTIDCGTDCGRLLAAGERPRAPELAGKSEIRQLMEGTK